MFEQLLQWVDCCMLLWMLAAGTCKWQRLQSVWFFCSSSFLIPCTSERMPKVHFHHPAPPLLCFCHSGLVHAFTGLCVVGVLVAQMHVLDLVACHIVWCAFCAVAMAYAHDNVCPWPVFVSVPELPNTGFCTGVAKHLSCHILGRVWLLLRSSVIARTPVG
jgi:hypothetical protein